MKKLFLTVISVLMILGVWTPVNAEAEGEAEQQLTKGDDTPNCSVSVTPEKVSFGSMFEGYKPQDPKTIVIKNTGNQPIKLEKPGKTWKFYITLDKTELAPGEEATVTIRLEDKLSAGTPETLQTSIKYTSKVSSCEGRAEFAIYYAVKHNMRRVGEKEPTHLEDGNKEYYYCKSCNKYFKNAAGSDEWTLEEIIIPRLKDHTTTGTWRHDEKSHWHTCECGEVLDKADHDFKWVTDKEATATEAGSRHEECTVCGYEKAAVKIPAAGMSSDTGKSKGSAETGNVVSPKTGDDSDITLWATVMLAAGAALTGSVIYSSKKKHGR